MSNPLLTVVDSTSVMDYECFLQEHTQELPGGFAGSSESIHYGVPQAE